MMLRVYICRDQTLISTKFKLQDVLQDLAPLHSEVDALHLSLGKLLESDPPVSFMSILILSKFRLQVIMNNLFVPF